MPELPEVVTVVYDLRPLMAGRRITAVEVGPLALRRPWPEQLADCIIGRHIWRVSNRGKWIIIQLTGGPYLVVHLGMTGQLVVTPADAPLPDHTHAIFTLDRGRQLRFRDIRRFGSISLFENADQMERFFLAAGLGWMPWGLSPTDWQALFACTNRCLKAVLLDQRAVAGVGNIYADESLYEARLHPSRSARTLSPVEAHRLGRAVVKVLDRAIAKRGSSIRNYVGGSGLKGEYQDEFRVYGRTGQPCRRCGTPIERLRVAGRSSHFCPRCQGHLGSPS